MNTLSATLKGFITGIIMVLISVAIFLYRGNFENKLQYFAYFTYIAGVLWTLVSFRHTTTGNKTFKAYFTQGFKCFIVITLIMVLFTWIFLQLNPGLKELMATQYRADLVKAGNFTASEIDVMVLKSKQYFITIKTSMAIFGYLIIGGLVTVIASAFLSQRAAPQEGNLSST